MSLAAQFRALIDRRAALAAELSGIDVELSEARGLLVEMFGATAAASAPPVPAPPEPAHAPAALPPPMGARPAHVPPFTQPRPCERCGKEFTPRPGSAGRFCSRACFCRPKVAPLAAVAPQPLALASTVGANLKTDDKIIEARDAAVLDAIRRIGGVGSIRDLRLRFPKTDPAASNPVTLDEALRNSLSRLRSKGLIGRTADSYSLVGAGSEIGRG